MLENKTALILRSVTSQDKSCNNSIPLMSWKQISSMVNEKMNYILPSFKWHFCMNEESGLALSVK